MAISQITSNSIAAGAVSASDLADGSVTNAKIDTVAASKITGVLPIANGGTNRSTALAVCYAYVSSDTGNYSGNTKAPMNASLIDNFSGFNTSTNTYTCQQAGTYYVCGRLRMRNGAGATPLANQPFGYIYKNGSVYFNTELDLSSQIIWTATPVITGVLTLAVNDTITLYGHYNNNSFFFRGVDTNLLIQQIT